MLDDAALAAEKLRAALAALVFPVVGHQTGSFGVAAFVPGDSAETMVSRADVAL